MTQSNASDFRTPRYQSPEAAQGEFRRASDVWSLGVVFLEMVTFLRGKTLAEMDAFLNRHGQGVTSIHNNIEGAMNWFGQLQAYDSGFGSPIDNEPLTWIKPMLNRVQSNRPTAEELVDNIVEFQDGRFCGRCCLDTDSSSNEGFESDDDMLSDISENHESGTMITSGNWQEDPISSNNQSIIQAPPQPIVNRESRPVTGMLPVTRMLSDSTNSRGYSQQIADTTVRVPLYREIIPHTNFPNEPAVSTASHRRETRQNSSKSLKSTKESSAPGSQKVTPKPKSKVFHERETFVQWLASLPEKFAPAPAHRRPTSSGRSLSHGPRTPTVETQRIKHFLSSLPEEIEGFDDHPEGTDDYRRVILPLQPANRSQTMPVISNIVRRSKSQEDFQSSSHLLHEENDDDQFADVGDLKLIHYASDGDLNLALAVSKEALQVAKKDLKEFAVNLQLPDTKRTPQALNVSSVNHEQFSAPSAGRDKQNQASAVPSGEEFFKLETNNPNVIKPSPGYSGDLHSSTAGDQRPTKTVGGDSTASAGEIPALKASVARKPSKTSDQRAKNVHEDDTASASGIPTSKVSVATKLPTASDQRAKSVHGGSEIFADDISTSKVFVATKAPTANDQWTKSVHAGNTVFADNISTSKMSVATNASTANDQQIKNVHGDTVSAGGVPGSKSPTASKQRVKNVYGDTDIHPGTDIRGDKGSAGGNPVLKPPTAKKQRVKNVHGGAEVHGDKVSAGDNFFSKPPTADKQRVKNVHTDTEAREDKASAGSNSVLKASTANKQGVKNVHAGTNVQTGLDVHGGTVSAGGNSASKASTASDQRVEDVGGGTAPASSIPAPKVSVATKAAKTSRLEDFIKKAPVRRRRKFESASVIMGRIMDDKISESPTSLMSVNTRAAVSGGLVVLRWNDKAYGYLPKFVAGGKVGAVRECLKAGCNPGTELKPRWAPVYNAVRGSSDRHLKCLRELVYYGADVNVKRSNNGRTPLHYAVESEPWSGYSSVIYTLLAAGADPNIRDWANDLPLLMLLVGNGPLSQAKRDALFLLLAPNFTTDLNVQVPGTLDNPLHLAIRRKDPYTVDAILEKLKQKRGSTSQLMHVHNGSGFTPILLALTIFQLGEDSDEELQIIEYLLKRGANANDADATQGKTPLHLIIGSSKNTIALELLCRHSADAELPDLSGLTAISLVRKLRADYPQDRWYKFADRRMGNRLTSEHYRPPELEAFLAETAESTRAP